MLYVSVRGSRLQVAKLRRSSAVMERIEDIVGMLMAFVGHGFDLSGLGSYGWGA